MNKWIDSLELAEEAGKDHRNVLRDIRNEMATKDLTEVEEATYKTTQGKTLLKYNLTEEAAKQMASRWSSKAAACLLGGGSLREALKLCKPKDKSGSVYIIHNTETGRCKIGKASDVHKRFKELQRATDCDLELVHYTEMLEDPHALEKELHTRFKSKQKRGEWFNITPTEAMAALKGEEFEVPKYLVKMTSQEVADYLEVPHQYIIDAAEAEIEDHQKPPEEIGFEKTLQGYCMNTLALHLLTAKLNMVERFRLGGYVSDLNDKAVYEDIFSS